VTANAGRDPGLQPERTALAWQRTGLSAMLVGIVTSVTAARLGAPIVVTISALVVLGVVVLVMRHFPRGVLPSSGRLYAFPPLLRIAVAVCAISLVSGVLAVVSLLDAGGR
jgi:hypothetical protein